MNLLNELETCIRAVPDFASTTLEWWLDGMTHTSGVDDKMLVFVNFPAVDGNAVFRDSKSISYQITMEYKFPLGAAAGNSKDTVAAMYGKAFAMRAIVDQLVARQNSGACSMHIDVTSWPQQRIGVVNKVCEVLMSFTIAEFALQ